MLKDCLEIFKNQLEKYGDKLIIDSYIPVDGTYIIVSPKDEICEIKEKVNIKLDKKTKEINGKSNIYYSKICNYDYNSKLIDMNKSIDIKKIIHSNNYLSFFVKKESLTNGKLTEEIIDNYYNILSNPYLKYSKKNAKSLYETVEQEFGKVNLDLLEKIRRWIKENIFNLGVEITGKDYLKIFFEYPIEDYQREGKRYLIPNIYNSNDFNQDIDGSTYGLPNDNMGLNSKKPYLENKTRKVKVPYLIGKEEVLLQKKFFDYLMNMVSVGKINIYINNEINGYKNGDLPKDDFNGLFLRIKKGKEVEIHNCDIVTGYKAELARKCKFENVLGLNAKGVALDQYGDVGTKTRMQEVINDVFFSKFLINNYFTDASDMTINDWVLKNNLLLARDTLFNWFYKGASNGVYLMLDNISLSLIKGAINNGYLLKAAHQFNLRWSLKKYFKEGENMADIISEMKDNLRKKINLDTTSKFDNDVEYYFAVGQLINYLLSKSKGKKKPQSLVNPFINAKNDDFIKEKLRNLYKKYNYDIEMNGKRVKNLYGMIVSYKPESNVNQDMVIAGYLHSNLVYESDKKEEKINE